jgi:hypothetical protein
MAFSEVLSWNLPGDDENHEDPTRKAASQAVEM